jgi:hypothetical protein
VTEPAEPLPEEPSGFDKTAAAVVAVATVVLGAVGVWWLVTGGQNLQAGEDMAPQIAEHFADIAHTKIDVECPDGVKTRKGKISDCTATRVDNGATSAVFVTSLDGDGHYSFQAADPAALVTP